MQAAGDAGDVLRRIGSRALAARTVSAGERRKVIASRLPVHTWPVQRRLVVAVDARDGERRTFDRTGAVDLVDAVAANCAVPGIWPTVDIGGRPYMDGGTYSTDNADLAIGFDRVLVLALRASVPPLSVVRLETAMLPSTRRRSAGPSGARPPPRGR